ncbi:mitotic-spindle organizing protein 1 isoform X2 [Meles meles]|uniref:mitotic-spindle organizing protein 1 isoform X2 n=1 Tax=Meles meles TaxID=9662 RepID=UPI001E69B19B|nr:mitotic-spindle organizing protein 1 isoform X2 [Meles meles]
MLVPALSIPGVLLEISRILNTGLDMETLSICVRLCEQGINPEALSSVIKELRKATEALKTLRECKSACKCTQEQGEGQTKEEERECQADSVCGTQAPQRFVYVVCGCYTVLFIEIMLRCTNILLFSYPFSVSGYSIASSAGLLGLWAMSLVVRVS